MEIKRDIIEVNFSKGRGGHKIDGIAVHVMEGTMDGTRSWFKFDGSDVSAHYGISKKGEIEQWVEEEDRAWHAGRVSNPTAELVLERPGVNPNFYTIGIEHEGSGNDDLTPAQRTASASLIADIASRHGFPVTPRHVFGHHTIYSKKTCPGKIDVPKLIAAAQPVIAPPAPLATPKIVWSDYFGDYLVATRIVSDREWYFVRMKSLPPGDRAQTALSAMPLTRPG